ncbi:MAG: protein DA1 [Rikenellaceae bacterium]
MEKIICKICNEPIVDSQYYHNEWGESMHIHHKDSYCRCSVCGRFQTKAEARSTRICDVCVKMAVKDQTGIDWVQGRVKEILIRNGIEIDFDQIPIEIVNITKLIEVLGRDRDMTDLQGATKTIKKESAKLGVRFSYKIYMLDQLPRIAFANILAHEYMHVWLNGANIKMSQDKIEGFCNMGSFLVLDTIKHTLSNFIIKGLMMNRNPIYGDGFRFMKEQYDKFGWPKLLAKVRDREF